MLKKIILLLLIPIFISCNKINNSESEYTQEVKNVTINSEKVGSIIKQSIENKSGLFLTYPEYVTESYSLIKYLASLLKQYGQVTVYIPQYPIGVNSDSLLDILRVEAPLLAIEEILELNTYLEKNSIKLSGTIEKTKGKVLILAPEAHYDDVKKVTQNNFLDNELIYVVMAGTEQTTMLKQVINKIPEGKKISSLNIKNTLFNKDLNEFDVLVLMDNYEKYNLVTPIKLYNVDNYKLAPDYFLENNSSFLESITLTKLNTALPKLIKKYGDKL